MVSHLGSVDVLHQKPFDRESGHFESSPMTSCCAVSLINRLLELVLAFTFHFEILPFL